ncbi:MAG: acetyltransferase family protein [Glaciihabitans sp.]|nr:acetyltransferase family protein [Glaciihabitans sp.]
MHAIELPGFTVSTADDDASRRRVQELFSRTIDGASPTAVPKVADNNLYAPLVLQVHSAAGKLVAAGLSLRAPMAIWYFAELKAGEEQAELEEELDRVSNLDLMAVEPEFRGQGLGALLIAEMAKHLSHSGTRVWFGGISKSDNSASLVTFYEKHGFKVLEPGAPLPNFLGRRWTVPHTSEPRFWFYTTLKQEWLKRG